MKKGELEHIAAKDTEFKVPTNYFNTVENNILDKITSSKSEFNTPNSYFDRFEEKIITKIREEENKSLTGYTTPKNYFEQADEVILDQIDTHKPIVISLKSILLKRFLPIAVAASLALIVYLNYNKNNILVEDISALEIEQWIENDLIELEIYEIAEVYQGVEINYQDFNTEDEENVLEYLNGTDIELLLLEN